MERKDKIQSFLNDPEMAKAVYSVLKRMFLKTPANKDVQTLAAHWIAKDLLDTAWKELERLKVDINSEKKEVTNIGV